MLFPLGVDRIIFVDSDQVWGPEGCGASTHTRHALLSPNLLMAVKEVIPAELLSLYRCTAVPQVIRTDLAELFHMDIKGAPYAYTPFCDNNKEMDEFRFWKGGFWRDHLQVQAVDGWWLMSLTSPTLLP